MPRSARKAPGGVVFHVLNRGNDRKTLFHKRGDANAFLRLIAEARKLFPGMRVLAFCLMGNHWHLVLWPSSDGELSAFMAWLSNSHVRRHRQHYHTAGLGHLYQGRFKSFPVQEDEHHLRLLLRYVEANALRAGLVERAEDWQWGSLYHALHGNPLGLLDPWPIERPRDWTRIVNAPLKDDQLIDLRTSVTRSRPLGAAAWVEAMAKAMGIEFTLRRRGRPKGDVGDAGDAGDVQNIQRNPSAARNPQMRDLPSESDQPMI
jgi:putative transposase